jgi:hypothetical protein
MRAIAFFLIAALFAPPLLAVANAPVRAEGQLAQTRADDDRRREEQREERIKERQEERRERIERDLRERNREWREERQLRQNRAADDLKRRREKEIFERFRRMEEGYPTSRDHRLPRDRSPTEPHPDAEMLLTLFPPAWVPGILAGRVERGWNVDAVIAARGRPEKITRTGPKTEVWHYPATRVTLEDGAVSEVTPVTPKTVPGPPR